MTPRSGERDVILRQEHSPGQQGLSDFTGTAQPVPPDFWLRQCIKREVYS
jgi:hypothetical protein